MPGQLKLVLGVQEIAVPIKGTNTRINGALKRYCIVKGIETEGRSAEEIGTDVLNHLLQTVRDVSKTQQRLELHQAQDTLIEAQIATDNDL